MDTIVGGADDERDPDGHVPASVGSCLMQVPSQLPQSMLQSVQQFTTSLPPGFWDGGAAPQR